MVATAAIAGAIDSMTLSLDALNNSGKSCCLGTLVNLVISPFFWFYHLGPQSMHCDCLHSKIRLDSAHAQDSYHGCTHAFQQIKKNVPEKKESKFCLSYARAL